MSRHLRALKAGGLVEDAHPDFDARVRIYRLKDGATDELKTWLAETEARWAPQLAGFKRHIAGDGEDGAWAARDRTSVVKGKSVCVGVGICGSRLIKKKIALHTKNYGK